MSTPDQLFNEISDDIAGAWEREGVEIVDAIKWDLSVPIQIVRGPRGGKKILRSKKGEHPRTETGKLREGVAGEVSRDGVNCALIISDPVIYSAFLDPTMDRPILTGIGEDFAEKLGDVTAKAIEGTT